jgi:hypothetical protein
LRATLDALPKLVAELRPEAPTVSQRLDRAHTFARRDFSRVDYARLLPSIAMPTASRDLRAGVDAGILLRRGDKATARYRFRRQRRPVWGACCVRPRGAVHQANRAPFERPLKHLTACRCAAHSVGRPCLSGFTCLPGAASVVPRSSKENSRPSGADTPFG